MGYAITIINGNLGRDPEMRYTPGGQAVTNFSVAVNRTYTNGAGDKVEEVTWYKVAAWGKNAENCNQYLHKGSLVLVEGRLVPGPDGNPPQYKKGDDSVGTSFELSASRVVFLSPRGEDTGSAPAGATEEKEDIPF